MSGQNTTEATCRKTGSMLSDYVDNSLSAREMWEVEKHLAICAGCSQLAERTHQIVQVLRSTDTLNIGDQFMADLHTRLDSLGPVPARRSPGTVVCEWFYDIRRHFNTRPIPTFSVGIASLIVAALMFSGRPGPVTAINTGAAVMAVSQEALDRHVAVTASDPFDDPVAAKLEAESGISRNDTQPGTN